MSIAVSGLCYCFRMQNKYECKGKEQITFDVITTNKNNQGKHLDILIRLSEEVVAPAITIWVEDIGYTQVENLFIPQKFLVVPNMVHNINDLEEPDVKKALQYIDFAPSKFPIFKYRKSNFEPNYNGITPVNSFILQTITTMRYNYRVFIEVSYNNITELYYVTVDTPADKLYLFESTENQFILEGVLKVG